MRCLHSAAAPPANDNGSHPPFASGRLEDTWCRTLNWEW